MGRALVLGAVLMLWPATARADVLSAIVPRTFLGGIVKPSDGMGSSFGFGLSLSRLTEREGHRTAIGYDLTMAHATKWWTVSPQLRPGVSTTMKDLFADAYLAVGADGTGGEAAPVVPFAPVAGVGFDVIAPLPVFTADLAAQVLADPKGLHSYTVHGGLLFGDGRTRPRAGVSFTSHGDAGRVWLVTFGVTFLGHQAPTPTSSDSSTEHASNSDYSPDYTTTADDTTTYDDTSDDTTTYDDTTTTYDDNTTTYDDDSDDTTTAIDPEWRDMVERTWDGESEVIAMLVEHGRTGTVIHAELDMTHTMRLWLSGDSVTGNVTTLVYIDDIGYEAKSDLWGTIDFDDATLKLQGSLKAATPPPYGLMWCNGDQKLKLYADADREGHYILRGTMATLCGGDSDVEWSDQ